jgi:hypothetical protein
MLGIRLALCAVLIGTAGAGLLLLAMRDAGEAEGGRASASYEQLLAANYRVLTPAETKLLLRFADEVHVCLTDHGVEIREPKLLNTRIDLQIPPGSDRESLARVVISCGDALGGPPPGASLQSFNDEHPDAVVLYLPKRCLLDKKVTAPSGGAT